MTRAFGDQDMKSAGIISRPDISITKLPFINIYANKTGNEKLPEDKVLHNNSSTPTSQNDSTVTHFDTTTSFGENDTFLMLFSDGLDQVQGFDEVY